MQYVDKKIKAIKPLKVQVMCEHRFSCYQKYVEAALSTLQIRFKLNGQVKNSLFNETSLIQGLVDLLDEIVAYYVSRDNERYDNKNDFPIKNLSPEQYASYLIRKYKFSEEDDKVSLSTVLDCFTNNFIQAMKKALMRTDYNHESIVKCFFPEFAEKPNDIYLSKVIPTGSDFHRGSQQVLVLEYKKKTWYGMRSEIVGKIIYKPTSLWVDAMLVGDTKRLRERGVFEEVIRRVIESGKSYLPDDLDEVNESANLYSLTELLNRYLDKDAKTNTRMPTQLIYPIEEEQLNGGYGYMEYFSHEPWFDENEYKEKIINLYETNQNERLFDKKYSNLKRKTFENIEQQVRDYLNSGRNVDYVVRTSVEKKQYSEQCGFLFVLTKLALIIDRHYENGIVSGQRMMLIDNETSGAVTAQHHIRNSNLFESDGIFSSETTLSLQLKFYSEKIGAFHKLGVGIFGKNQMWQLDEIGNLKPFLPRRGTCLRSIEYLLRLIKANSRELLLWLEQPCVQHVWVRVLPKSTSEFQEERTYIFDSLLGKTAFQNITKENLSDLLTFCKVNETGQNHLCPQEKIPTFAIYLTDQLFKAYCNYDIPSFYMRLNDTKLYDAEGNLVHIDYAAVARKLGYDVDEENHVIYRDGEAFQFSLATDQFFEESPLTAISRFIENISQDEDYIDKLIQEYSNCLSVFSDDENGGDSGEESEREELSEKEKQTNDQSLSEETYKDK